MDAGVLRKRADADDFDGTDDVDVLNLLRPKKKQRPQLSSQEEPSSTHPADHTLHLGGKIFSSKAAVKKYLKDVLESLQPAQLVTGEAADVLAELLKSHPNYVAKLNGSDVVTFSVESCSYTPERQKCFYLKRTDGTTDDLSVNRCLDGYGLSEEAASHLRSKLHSNAVRQALVESIIGHQVWFKKTHFSRDAEIRCPYTQQLLDVSTAKVVNAPPLTIAQLMREWMEADSIVLRDIQLQNADSRTRTLADDKLLKSWKHYFATHCKLQLVSEQGYKAKILEKRIDTMQLDQASKPANS